MRVRMKYQMSGTRDGVAWPAPGGEIDLSDGEAEMLFRNQMAEPVEALKAPEKTEDPKQGGSPKEATPKAPSKRGRPRKATTPKAVDR